MRGRRLDLPKIDALDLRPEPVEKVHIVLAADIAGFRRDVAIAAELVERIRLARQR